MVEETVTDYVFKTVPYAHQREAFLLGRDRAFHALLMEMGTGKSKVLVDTLAWLFERGAINAALIIAPKSVVRTWTAEQLPTHLPDAVGRRLIVKWSSRPKKSEEAAFRELFVPDDLCLKILVMNVEALSLGKVKNPGRAYVFAEAFLRGHRALMAIDESTTVKAPDANRTKNVLRLAKLAPYRRILTGTPVTQSPLDVYTQFEFLSPNLLECGNYFAFRNRYAVLKRRVINGRSFDEVVGFQRLEELQSLVGRHAYRKLKAECLDLPPKVYQTRYVELGEAQARIYRELRDNAMAELNAAAVVTAPLFLTKLLRLRQVAAGLMPRDDGPPELFSEIPRLAALTDTCEEITGKAIIWTSFVPIISLLVPWLNSRFGSGAAAAFYGDVSADRRQEIVEKFQDPADPLRFFVGQIRTGGLGLTLTAARTVIYYDHDWSLEARQQSEDRAHRIGQVGSVTYVDLVAEDTVDEVIIAALRAKKELADLVTGDGWRRLLGAGNLPL